MGEHPGVTRRREGRRSARRWPSLAVIAAGSLAVGALPALDDPRPAGASTDPGAIALWAGASESDGLTWSASKSQADALVHSNSDLVLSGSKNTLIGGVQYVDALTVSGSNNVIDPPPTATGVLDAPIAYEIDDYRPGGVAAFAAGDLYFDHSAECAVDGTWEQHVHGTEIPSGLHYVPCDVVISAAEISGSFTLVAEGRITVTGARLDLGPAFVDDLLLFSNADAPDAVTIAGGRSDLDGLVVAPRGGATVAGSGHDLRCPLIAGQVHVTGSDHTFDGDPACGEAARNHAPVAEDDTFGTDEDVELSVPAPGVLANDTDPDGDVLRTALGSAPTQGVATVRDDGSFTYLPAPDFHGTDSFTYLACDAEPLCDVARVTIDVAPVNDPPTADAGGPYEATAGTAVTFDGTGSSDVDGTIVTYSWDFGDGSGGSGDTVTHTYTTDGTFTVQLTVIDDGGLEDRATTSVDVAPAPNTAPRAVADEYGATEDITLVVTAPGVLDNDVDDDGDALTAALGDDVAHGSLTLGPDGSFTYVPVADFFGEDTFTYVADDGAAVSTPATVTITVEPVNDPPVADAGADQAVVVGELVTLDGSASSDPVEGDPLTYAWALTSRPSGSTATLTGATGVAPTFVPDLPGTYVVELTVDDGNGGTDTDTVVVTTERIGLTLTTEDPLIAVGRSTAGTVALDHPAPPGGVTVGLVLDTSVAVVDPTTVDVPAGSTEAAFTVTGVAVGTTTLSGTSPVTVDATVEIGVTDQVISVDDIPVIAPDETADLPVSISAPAPPGGVTLTLTSLDPTVAVTDPTVVIPEGQQVPATNPQITGVDFGTTQVKATGLGYAPDTRDVTVALVVTLTPDELVLPEAWTLPVTAQLSAPAPAGGITLQIGLDDPFADHPDTVAIPGGQTLSPPIELTGLIPGSTTLRVGGPGLVEGTVALDVVDTPDAYLVERVGPAYDTKYVNRQPFPVGLDLQFQAYVQLEVAPPGPVDVIASVPAGSGVLLSASPTEQGTETLVVESGLITTSQRTVRSDPFYVQGTAQTPGVDDDVPVTIEVVAAGTSDPLGYEQVDMPSEIDVGPAGISFYGSSDLLTTVFSGAKNVPVQSWLLHDGEAGTLDRRLRQQQVRGGLDVMVGLTSSDPGVGTVSDAVITGGTGGAVAIFEPVTAGTTVLGVVQPAGFTPPADGHIVRTVVVTAPDVYVEARLTPSSGWSHGQTFDIGKDLQIAARVRFEAEPPEPVDVIVSVPAGSGVLLSDSPTTVGTDRLVVETQFADAPYTSSFYVQGLVEGDDVDDDVSISIDVVATGTTTPVGYDPTDIPSAVDVGPSGFSFSTDADLAATTFPDTEVAVRAWRLYDTEDGPDRVGRRHYTQTTRSGLTIGVDLTSSDESVALPTAPAVFPGGTATADAVLDGLTAGTSILGITQPPGHTAPAEPSSNTSRTAVVTAPDVWLQEPVAGGYRYLEPFLVGEDLQFRVIARLEVAPPEPVDVIVSAPVGSGLLFSAEPDNAGTPSLVVATGFTSTAASPRTPDFYVQGTIEGDDVDDDIVVTIDVLTSGTGIPVGYEQTDMPSSVDVGPSGFSFNTGADLTTTTFSPDQDVPVIANLLYDTENDRGYDGRRRATQQVRGGLSVTVEVTTSSEIIGEIVAPAAFTGGQSRADAVFDPQAAGVTTLQVVQPAGFTAPVDPNAYVARDAVVDAPDLELLRGSTPSPEELIGQDLQVERRIGLEVAPPAPGVDVTVEVVDPTVATISTDPTAVGGASITFPLVTGTATPLFHLQALSVGEGTELRVTAAGYDQWITTIQTVPAGFYITLPTADFTTSAGANDRTVRVAAASLDASQRVDEVQRVRGGTTPAVEVVSSDPTVGTITVSPLVFTSDDAYRQTAFTPLAAGTTTISVVQPAGFTAPIARTSVVATVEPG